MLRDPLGHGLELPRAIVQGHIFRRHPELKGKLRDIKETLVNPYLIARSKKDNMSLLYFRKVSAVLYLMAVASPKKGRMVLRTSFYVYNTSKGDPIIWKKKIST